MMGSRLSLVGHQIIWIFLCCYSFVVPHSTSEIGFWYSEGELKFQLHKLPLEGAKVRREVMHLQCKDVEQYIIAVLGMVVKHRFSRTVPGNHFSVHW